MATRKTLPLLLVLLTALVMSACNLSGAPSAEQIAQTNTAGATIPPTWTPVSNGGVPTTFPVTQPTFTFPTAVIIVPTSVPPVFIPTAIPPAFFPTNTSLPVSIVILSPLPGNVVAGNVQILGSASHPQFLQYQVEFGPDPNPANLWFPATAAVTNPVFNGLLGIWNTTAVQDSKYQLRLRVYLRDGTLLTTAINNITVQNRVNTPVPSATLNIPRPIAAFTQDQPSGNVPLIVHFTNQSTGTVSTFNWNFGDGTTSGDPNPQHTFTTPGLYNVTLTVTGPGGTSNVSRQINATSPSAPVAGFTQDRTAGVAPLTVQFFDQSSGTISSYLWNFSDGTASGDRNPVHIFYTPGTYNIFLTVSGPGGSSSVTRQITVTSAIPATATPTNTFTPVPPTATFTLTTTVIPPTATFTPTNTTTAVPPTLTFTPTDTTIPPIDTDTPTATFTPAPPTATFTDTTTVIPPTATFTPTDTTTPVPPTATFTPTDTTIPPTDTFTPIPPTLTPSETPTDTPTPIPAPQASFTANADPNNPLSIQFTSQATGQIVGYNWDFGDGSNSTDQNPQHTYATGGTYTVILTVTDVLGRTAQFAANVVVQSPVAAQFAASVSGLSVQFTNQSTGPVAAVQWDFGDGGNSTDQNPQHTYAAPGTYNVTLTVTSADGRSNQMAQQVNVTQPVQAAFAATPSGLSVQFTDQSTGQIAARQWDFGDGSNSTDQNPQHTYAAAGTYNVTLTVTGTDGSSNQVIHQVTVSAPVHASFSAVPSGLSVQFTDQSTGSVAARQWDFGDGSNSTDQNPQHTYAAAGTYNVTLTVTGTDGSNNQAVQQVTVSQPVQAAFNAAPSGLAVQFTDQSTGSVAARQWDFGDGSNSTDQNPQHTYAAAGTYNVTLTVTGTDGSSNQVVHQVTVSAPVQAAFAAAPSGLSVQFTDQSTGQIASRQWDFGDGANSTDQNPQHAYAGAGTYNVTLTVTGTDGSNNQAVQQVTVSQPVQAAFNAAPSGLSVQFTDQSTGQIASRQWDFGDGSNSTDQNPQHTYAGAGTYNVTLTVTGTDGSNNQAVQQVTVSQPVQAAFSAAPTDLTVQFTDQSTGSVAARQWDFGDGSNSTDQNPQHAYAAAGTYNVTLTVTGTDGSSNQSAQQVTVTAPAQPTPTAIPQSTGTIVDNTPIQPDFNAVAGVLRAVYVNGASAGNRATVFAKAGDSIFAQPGVLDTFATGGQYNLDNHSDLQAIINRINSTDLGGTTSFNHASMAVNAQFRAQDLLDPSKSDPSCNGAAPLVCELQQSKPVLMFVAVGQNDAQQGTDPTAFHQTLRQIVDTISGSGTIPVLLTLPNPGSNPALEAINEQIIAVAQEANVPLLNAARQVTEAGNFNAANSGPGTLSNGAVQGNGINALNLDLLQVLSDARNIVFPDAP